MGAARPTTPDRPPEATTPHPTNKLMLTLKWVFRMLFDLVMFGITNRAVGMSMAVIGLLFLGVMILAVKITAPFIYTLF
jgi:hypothetical protein